MSITIDNLPYDLNGLEPFISEKTLTFHYQKHYMGYVKTANELLESTPFKDKTLKEIILISASDKLYTKLFNNAAQVFNHNFYWQSIKPKAEIPPEVKKLLTLNFGSIDHFKSELLTQGLNQFGSGYVWLVSDQTGRLKIMATANAATPIIQRDTIPLCCIDVWEHAYYLDYQNRRAEYLENIINHLLNWDFIWKNYKPLLPE